MFIGADWAKPETTVVESFLQGEQNLAAESRSMEAIKAGSPHTSAISGSPFSQKISCRSSPSLLPGAGAVAEMV